MSVNEAKNKIFDYLRRNRITLIKKSNINVQAVETLFQSLKIYRKSIKNDAGDNDLEIISIYKSHNMDLIMGRNNRHFKPFCDYVGITFDSLIDDVDAMWKNVFGWKKHK